MPYLANQDGLRSYQVQSVTGGESQYKYHRLYLLHDLAKRPTSNNEDGDFLFVYFLFQFLYSLHFAIFLNLFLQGCDSLNRCFLEFSSSSPTAGWCWGSSRVLATK